MQKQKKLPQKKKLIYPRKKPEFKKEESTIIEEEENLNSNNNNDMYNKNALLSATHAPPIHGELSTSESKDSESYKQLVITLKNELESLENKSVSKKKK